MIHQMNGRPITASIVENARPSILLPVPQRDAVKSLFIKHKIPHSVSDWEISVDDKPKTTVVYLEGETDPSEVQQLLDSRL